MNGHLKTTNHRPRTTLCPALEIIINTIHCTAPSSSSHSPQLTRHVADASACAPNNNGQWNAFLNCRSRQSTPQQPVPQDEGFLFLSPNPLTDWLSTHPSIYPTLVVVVVVVSLLMPCNMSLKCKFAFCPRHGAHPSLPIVPLVLPHKIMFYYAHPHYGHKRRDSATTNQSTGSVESYTQFCKQPPPRVKAAWRREQTDRPREKSLDCSWSETKTGGGVAFN